MRLTTVGLVCALFLLLFGKVCDGGGGTPLVSTSPTPVVLTVALNAPGATRDGKNDHIINGTSVAYLVTVTRVAGSTANLSGPIELHGARDELPGQPAFDVVLGTRPATVSGDLATTAIFLSCTPAPPPVGGRAGTLTGPQLGSGHGGRVCISETAPPCAPGCGVKCGPQGPIGCGIPCAPGCGGTAVTCTDDPVMVYARFAGVDSPAISVLCIPSVGPTSGTL